MLRKLLIPIIGIALIGALAFVFAACSEPKDDPATLASIAVTTNPTKTAYTAGDTLNLAGMVVTATYSDNSTKAVTAYTTDPAANAVLNDTALTSVLVSYTEGGVTKDTSFVITVNAQPVTAAELQELIDDAEALKTTVDNIDTDGSNTLTTELYVTEAEMEALNAAILAAEEAIDNDGDLDAAYAALEEAMENFVPRNGISNKLNPVITKWPTATAITYGDTLEQSTLSDDAIVDVAGSFDWTNGNLIPTVSNEGYEVTFTPDDTDRYNTRSHTVAVTVNKVTLTVTAENKSTTYNTAAPSFTYAITGFVNSETSSVVTGTPSLTSTYTVGSSVNTYPITVAIGTLAAANYDFDFVNGTLTVNKATPTVTFPTATGIAYGAKLSTSSLTGGSTSLGSFAWEDGETVPSLGTTSHNVVFTPSDTANYDYTGITGWNSGTSKVVRTVSITVTCTHTWGAWSTNEGNHERSCTAGCGEKQTHTINWGNWTSKDATSHKRDCTGTDCDLTDEAPHNIGDWLPTTAASFVQQYEESKSCSVCGYSNDTRTAQPKPITNITDYNAALVEIRTGGNGTSGSRKQYTMTINGDIAGITPLTTNPTAGAGGTGFGTVTYITVTLKGNGTLDTADSNGSMFRLGANQQLVIDSENLTLRGRKQGESRGGSDTHTGNNDNSVVYINGANAAVTLTSGTISGNYNTSNTNTDCGGGVNVVTGTLTINGGTISGNTSTSSSWGGGGVNVNGTSSIFTMSSGFIKGNTATNQGGGVHLNTCGASTMTGGTIGGTSGEDANTVTSGNKTGAGVYSNNCSFTLTGGTIIGNNGQGLNSAGTSGSFTMNSGSSISNNTGYGVSTSRSFTMNGGTITGNGDAAVRVEQGGGFTMTSGTITDIIFPLITGGGFTVYNDATIGTVRLNRSSSGYFGQVTIAESWTGSIGSINLFADDTLENVISSWNDQIVLRQQVYAVTPAQLAQVTLGNFIAGNNANPDIQAISNTYSLVLEETDGYTFAYLKEKE